MDTIHYPYCLPLLSLITTEKRLAVGAALVTINNIININLFSRSSNSVSAEVIYMPVVDTEYMKTTKCLLYITYIILCIIYTYNALLITNKYGLLLHIT